MAKFGLIGNPLIHSISPQIHALFGLENYGLFPLKESELSSFVKDGNMDGFNVTIPYKEKIIPFLSSVKGAAKAIGAVNTVVKTDDGYVGYNTDADGMIYALQKANVFLGGKTVFILGTGGTSKTAEFVAVSLGAKSVKKVGRTAEINYENVYSYANEVEIIINATPVGTFPDVNSCPVDVKCFSNLSGVFDCVYNPSETVLIKEARKKGIPAANGLLMLIEQARKAEELFLEVPRPPALTEQVAEKLGSLFNGSFAQR